MQGLGTQCPLWVCNTQPSHMGGIASWSPWSSVVSSPWLGISRNLGICADADGALGLAQGGNCGSGNTLLPFRVQS